MFVTLASKPANQLVRLALVCLQTIAFMSPYFGVQGLKAALLAGGYFPSAENRVAAIDALVPVAIGVTNVSSFFVGPVVETAGPRRTGSAALLLSAVGLLLPALSKTAPAMYASAVLTALGGTFTFFSSFRLVLEIDPVLGLAILLGCTEASALLFPLLAAVVNGGFGATVGDAFVGASVGAAVLALVSYFFLHLPAGTAGGGESGGGRSGAAADSDAEDAAPLLPEGAGQQPPVSGLLAMPPNLRPAQVYAWMGRAPLMWVFLLWAATTLAYAYLTVALADRALAVTLPDDPGAADRIFTAFNWVLPTAGFVYAVVVAPVVRSLGDGGMLGATALAIALTAATSTVTWAPLQYLMPPAVSLLRYVMFLGGMTMATAFAGPTYSVYATGATYGVSGCVLFVNLALQPVALASTTGYYGVSLGEAGVAVGATLALAAAMRIASAPGRGAHQLLVNEDARA
jgi:hypothetical protein